MSPNDEIFNRMSLESTTKRLAELEKDWAALGPLRFLTFILEFGSEDSASSFSSVLVENGFSVAIHDENGGLIRLDEICEFTVRATIQMEPTVQNVTYWEQFIKSQLQSWNSNVRGENRHIQDERIGTFIGWSYPESVTPTFSLEGRVWSHRSAEERTKVLFGSTLCNDRMKNGKFTYRQANSLGSPFHLIPSKFLTKAQDLRPSNPEPNASSFAQWLYSLYADAYGSETDREEGKAAEEHILAARRSAYVTTDPKAMQTDFSDWRLMHNGLGSSRNNIPRFFTIDDLKVRGEPLRAAPDLLYRNQKSGEVLIVEIKNSRMTIPCNLWPNIWGQLWCYAQIDQVRAASKVTVVGEVWADTWSDDTRIVILRASVRRDPRAASYDHFFRSLFNIYRGSV